MKSHAGVVLAVLSLPLLGCGRLEGRSRTESPAAVFAFGELLRTLPEVFGGQSVWSLDREPALSAFLVDPRGARAGMSLNPHARTRIFVLRGALRVRAGAEERVLREGSYASLPRGMLRRLSPVGAEQVLYLRLLTPDVDKDVQLEPSSAPRPRRARADVP